jgi:hypothetical protein
LVPVLLNIISHYFGYMKGLAKLVQTETPSTAVHFRKSAYGRNGVRDFLRDVMAIANASIKGKRYIITGVDFDDKERKQLFSVDNEDFSGKPAYQSIANEYIEPPIRIKYKPVTVDGERIGVFEIGDCQDRPYMMRVDFSETLRRGDAYIRSNKSALKMGRRQLQALFEKKFKDSVSATNIEIGFPGEIIHKDRTLPTCSLVELPSMVASSKLDELIAAKEQVNASGSNTMVARLTHARLFGSDSPYEERSTEEIMEEMKQLKKQYRDHDDHYLFEEHRNDLQLVVLNQGEEPIRSASLTLVMPNHDEFHVATQLPKLLKGKQFVERLPAELADYPAVSLRDDSIHVSVKLGDIEPGEPTDVFFTPLRVCVGDKLAGRRLGIQYSLFAQNLRAPAHGKLRLLL